MSLKDKLVHATNENIMLVQDVAYLTSRLERIKLSEKMIKEELSQVDECVTHSIHKLGLVYERCEDKGEISTKFVPSSTYNDEEETLKAKQIPYPPNPKSSFNPKRAQKQTTNSSMSNLDGVYICMFVVVRVTWLSFAFDAREWRRGVWTMLETHIEMSSLIFCLILILVPHLAFLLVLCLISSMDLTIAHMILVHERTALSLDALVTAHVLIVVIISCVGLVFLLEGLTLTLSRDICRVHVFPIVVHVPLDQMVSCKEL
jgi:hypothetical protein